MTPADTTQFLANWNRLDDQAKTLMSEVINGMSRGRLSCEEVAIANDRILAGENKLEVLEGLVQLSNERIFEETNLDE